MGVIVGGKRGRWSCWLGCGRGGWGSGIVLAGFLLGSDRPSCLRCATIEKGEVCWLIWVGIRGFV